MSEINKPTDILQFLSLVGKLKHLPRTGWVLNKVEGPETVAGHMYRMAMMTFLIEDPSLDRTRLTEEEDNLDPRNTCMEMSLVHDLAESVIGDYTPHCNITKEEKHRRESEAMKDIAKLIGKRGDHVERLFQEYEEQSTLEAKFVRDLDLFDMSLQAFEYEKSENNPGRLQEFIDSTKEKLKHPEVTRIADEMYKQRMLHKKLNA